MRALPEENVRKFVEALSEKKAENITVIDIRERTIIADWFIVAEGRSTTHVKALSDDVQELLAREGIFARRKEGYAEGRWIVLDFGDVLMHIFHHEEREYYNIERLWSDGVNQFTYRDGEFI